MLLYVDIKVHNIAFYLDTVLSTADNQAQQSVMLQRKKSCYKLMYEARVKGFQAFLLYPATIKLS